MAKSNTTSAIGAVFNTTLKVAVVPVSLILFEISVTVKSATSLSTIVIVLLLSPTIFAPTTTPISTMMISPESSIKSSIVVIVISPDNCPAGITTEEILGAFNLVALV